MNFKKILRRTFKIQLWSQYSLVLFIICLMFVIRVDKLLWTPDNINIRHLRSLEDGLEAPQAKECLVPSNAKDQAESSKGVQHLHRDIVSEAAAMVAQRKLARELDQRNALLRIHDPNKTVALPRELSGGAKRVANPVPDKDVKAIVSAYVKRNSALKSNRNTSNTALYQEIPPDYDSLLKVLMNTHDRCQDIAHYHLLIAVHTAPKHFLHRETFRWLYGDKAKTKPYQYKLVFFIGRVDNASLQEELRLENERFGDTVQGNFMDAYINMTYKAIMVFQWVDTHCRGLRNFFRVDDDVFMNMGRLYPRWTYVLRSKPTRTIMCNRLRNDLVLRKGKWAVPHSLVPGDKYEFMRCPGYFAAISTDLIHDMTIQARKVPFFWIDDIVMLGIVPNAVGNVYFYPLNRAMSGSKSTEDFNQCIQKNGDKCHYYLGITAIENFKTLYGFISGIEPLASEPDEMV